MINIILKKILGKFKFFSMLIYDKHIHELLHSFTLEILGSNVNQQGVFICKGMKHRSGYTDMLWCMGWHLDIVEKREVIEKSMLLSEDQV